MSKFFFLFSSVNWYGAYSLMLREVQRFLRVYHQTIISPVISSLIFWLIFTFSIGKGKLSVNNISYSDFIAYGLIIMTIIQNSFANSSSSLVMSKIIGYIYDILVPPLSGVEIVLAMALGSLIRGVVVGIVLFLVMFPFVSFHFYSPMLLIFFVSFSSLFMGQIGIISGIFAESFDQNSAITNYLIMPLSFLSGTFYSIKQLPSFLQSFNYFNPFFYMIDGFRYCLTNYSDSNINFAILFLVLSNFVLFFLASFLFNIGWRIKN